jgi:HicA-like toxin of HicAB toxin-antitoxin system
MSRLPRVTVRQIIAVLEKSGFTLARQSGSHMILQESCRQKSDCAVSRSEGASSESAEEHHARRRSVR